MCFFLGCRKYYSFLDFHIRHHNGQPGINCSEIISGTMLLQRVDNFIPNRAVRYFIWPTSNTRLTLSQTLRRQWDQASLNKHWKYWAQCLWLVSTASILEPNADWKLIPNKDGHNDWPHLIRGFYDNKLDRRFQRESNLAGHVDIKRLKEGRSGGAFWSVYIDWWA